jgi:ABC-2 type transport system permease protein
MPFAILKHYPLAFKNRLAKKKNPIFSREVFFFLVAVGFFLAIFQGTHIFFLKLSEEEALVNLIIPKLINFILLAALILLVIANVIAALGYLYNSQSNPLLLSLPISQTRLFFAKFIEINLSSSWMFGLFIVPFFAAFGSSLNLNWSFLPITLFTCALMTTIPTALSMVIVILFVNLVPSKKFREIIALIVFLILFLLGYRLLHSSGINSPHHSIQGLSVWLTGVEEKQTAWLPSSWSADYISSFVGLKSPLNSPLILLFLGSLGSIALAFLTFDQLFIRGLAIAEKSGDSKRIPRKYLRLIVRSATQVSSFAPHYRALLLKEIRMLTRDTSQAIQLILLLGLAFFYLYNFQSFREITEMDASLQEVWRLMLCVCNIALGSCVVCAIASRFIFPTVSLEGNCYQVIRNSPITIREYLLNKFYIWYPPVFVLNAIFLVTGAMIVEAQVSAFVLSVISAAVISISITGLSVGMGAVYAKFDWESPSEMISGFGNLAFMFIALIVVTVSLIPITAMFAIVCLPDILIPIYKGDIQITLICLISLMLAMNYYSGKLALKLGESSLVALEA